MNAYGFTPEYLTKNGRPWFPLMGEMHYSRYPARYWRESLLKMKAGGIDVVSAYVIWIHHEEIEGEWVFSGDRDLRRFVMTCAECGLSLMLRIGPWIHGEVRNGGLPDWVLRQPWRARTNDEGYFETVRTLYAKIFSQVEGLFLKDAGTCPGGGPIIGVQIENEYGHCGGLGGEEGEAHMRHLASIAREVGFDVPLWTATGWGGAVTGGLLPVMGGYCEAPWDQRLTEIEPSGNYIFTHERNDHNIGSDFGLGTGITFDTSKFPYLTAELGGGLQVTRHRRPVASASDIGAMSLAKLGSGVNLLGYYMYHGGTNPGGKLSTLHETKESGSINDLPELSYDFRAPVREWGQLSETYREIKLLALFLHDFGSGLCGMPADIPADNPLRPTDRARVRYSYRHRDGSGYLFVNNYQRRQVQADHERLVFSLPSGKSGSLLSGLLAPAPSGPGSVRMAFPPIDIRNGDYFFLPFNMKVGNALLETALVTPLCVLRRKRPVYVFYASFDQAERLLAEGRTGELYRFRDGKWPEDAEIRTLSRRDALDAWKVGEELIIERDELLVDGESVRVLSRKRADIAAFRELPADGADEPDVAAYEITVSDWDADDCFLRIDYEGDAARLYEDGLLIADNFYLGAGHVWEIGLKRFGLGKGHSFLLEIEALTRDTRVFLEEWPALEGGRACRLKGVAAELQTSREYRHDGN